ncbi:MAG TPA: glycosyltransferase [Chitinophagaceae bacterium]|nr:glycosyltransferase [Chitinophagaceae bacterium]
MKKKILLLSPQNVIPATDGGKIGIFTPMKMLAEEFDVKAIIFVGPSEYFDAADYRKMNVDAVIAPINKKDKAASALVNPLSDLPFKFAKYFTKKHKLLVEQICTTWKPDVIICHHAHLAKYCKDIKKKLASATVILREHNVEYLLVEQYYQNQNNFLLRQFSYWQFKKTKRFEECCWNYFDKIIFISDSDFKSFVNCNAKGFIIYDGTNNREHNITPIFQKSKSFLFSGSLHSYQNKVNLKNFIDTIWAPWKESNPLSEDYELWVTGDREENFVLDQSGLTAGKAGLYKIKILGFVEDLNTVMQKAMFFISPTIIGAGIRIKVLQALGLGCVTFLTTKDLEISSKLQDRENVLWYDGLTSFDEQVKKITADNSLYTSIAANAVRTVQDNFTWDIFYKKLKDIL